MQTSGAAEDPDVAYDANPNTGVAVYDSIPTTVMSVGKKSGGTSAGRPSGRP